MDIVEVIWLDAQEETEMLVLEAAEGQTPIPARTVGFLVKNSKDCVVVSASVFGEGEPDENVYRSTWTIPKGCIKEIRKLNDTDS